MVAMRKTILPGMVLLAMAAWGCGAARQSQPAADEPLRPEKHHVWQLVELRGRAVSRTAAVMTLTLNPEAGTLRMEGPCNRYGAAYRARLTAQAPEGDRYKLSVSHMEGGTTQCPDAEMNAEERHRTAIEKADEMVLTAYTLTLLQNGKTILRYELK